MAIVWEYQRSEAHYRVVKAGASIRLYTNGVFHSQYNPNQLINGSVWDLLIAPALHPRIAQQPRLLVMGVGGGTVISVLQKLLRPSVTVGLELNPLHLHIARHYFSVQRRNTLLLQTDAIRWADYYRGPAFDVVIDDLFGEHNGEPSRAIALGRTWFKKLIGMVTEQGCLVVNVDDTKQLQVLLAELRPHERIDVLKRSVVLQLPQYYNAVLVYYRSGDAELHARLIKEQLQQNAVGRHKARVLPLAVWLRRQ